MASVNTIICAALSFLFLSAVPTAAEHRFLPAPAAKQDSNAKTVRQPTNHPLMGMGLAVHQQDKKKPICDQFVLSYAKVRQVTQYLRGKLAYSTKQYKKCNDCALCTGCDTPYKNALIYQANQCIKKHGFSACAVAVSLLGRDSDIVYTCRFFLRESRVGNCYVHEYLALNGLTNKGYLVTNREIGVVDKKRFQCRAGKRARFPDLKNQHSCRSKFRVTVRQVGKVHTCARPAFSRASTAHSNCLSIANSIRDFWASWSARNQCFNNFIYQTNLAYINCIVRHGVPAVAVASMVIGQNALNCPTLRRDSWVGRCKAPDYVQLHTLKEIDTSSGYIKTTIPGACNYKK